MGERKDGAFKGRPGAREKGRSKRSVDDCDLRNDHQWFLSPASGGSRGKRLLPFGAWATQTHAVSGLPALWAQPPLSRIRSLARPSCPTATSSLHRRGDRDQSCRHSLCGSCSIRLSLRDERGGLLLPPRPPCSTQHEAPWEGRRKSTGCMSSTASATAWLCILCVQFFLFSFAPFSIRALASAPPALLLPRSKATLLFPSHIPIHTLPFLTLFLPPPPYFIRSRSCSMETRMAKPTPAANILHLAFKAARRRRRVPRSSQARST